MMLRIAAAALITIFAAACATGGAPTSTGEQVTAAATVAATTSVPATGSPSGDSALIDLIRGNKATAYKVTYQMKTTGGGQDTTTTFTQASKPPFFRVDVTGATAAESITSLVRPEGTYVCGAFLGSPACFSAGSGGGGLGVPAPPQPIPTDLTGWGITTTSGRTIAGQSTSCFNFSTPTGQAGAGAETIGCYTQQGIPLFMSSKSAGTEVSMTATQFTTNVSDADFAVPFPVQKLPGQP